MKLVFIQIAILSENNNHIENQILDKIIAAFDDDRNLQNWMKYNSTRQIESLALIIRVKRQVKSIIPVINTEEYVDVKSLIMETEINIIELGTTYYELFNVIKSIKHILKMNDEQNLSKSETYNMLNFVEEVLYKVYDKIYENLELTVTRVGYEFNYDEMWSIRFDKTNEVEVKRKNFSLTVDFFDSLNNMIDSILPVDYEISVYVIATSRKFLKSRKSYRNEMNCFTDGKYSMICPQDMILYLTRCSSFQVKMCEVDIKAYMGKVFLCNETTTCILISLFHYYSEILNHNLKYEIFLKENKQYQVVLSNCLSLKREPIKLNWLKKEIPDIEKRRKIPKFSFLVNYDEAYSTVETDDTEKGKINTRLILLDCGHQLGFDLIDEVFEHYYDVQTGNCLCTVCNKRVSIIGSYNAEVYKYK
jgi:hypothetical protein